MTYSESKALKALKKVKDPISGRDVVSAGMLGDLIFKDGILRAILMIDPAKAQQYETVRMIAQDALSRVKGVDKAAVVLTAHTAAPTLKSASKSPPGRKPVQPHQARRPAGRQGDQDVKTVLAVSSAKGGVGKSTVAVNLAVALAKQGKKVGLLDADIHGPSAPMLLGLRGELASTVERDGRTLIKAFEAYGIKSMSIGFMVKDDSPVVWRGPMVQGAISKMLWDVDWGELDYLIIDMPPGTGDPQLGLAQDIKPKGAVIVSTPQDLALLDARKGIQMFGKVDIPVIGLVENMSVFICPKCGEGSHIFGTGGAEQEAKKMGVPFLGAAPLTIAVRESGDNGVPIASGDSAEAKIFADIATAVDKIISGD